MKCQIPKNRGRFRAALGLLLSCGFLLPGCVRPPPPRTEFVMGTFCTVNLYRSGTPGLYREVFDRLRELEAVLSANLPGSDTSRVNAAAGGEAVRVRRELLNVLGAALDMAGASGGAFDPTVGPLVRLWGIGTDAARVPGEAELAAALSLVRWQDLVLDNGAGTALLRRGGMALDPGAIAKGYAADEIARMLAERKVRRALVDLGGNVYLAGAKGRNRPWLVGVQDPLDGRGATIGVLELPGDVSVVTSGVYERFFEREGRRYHHILSTADGYPARSGLLSVTIIAPSSMEADALSTAVFALGLEKGMELLAARGGGAEAVFVLEDMTVRCTPGAAGIFTPNGGGPR